MQRVFLLLFFFKCLTYNLSADTYYDIVKKKKKPLIIFSSQKFKVVKYCTWKTLAKSDVLLTSWKEETGRQLLKNQTPSNDPLLLLRGNIYVLQNEVNDLQWLSLSERKNRNENPYRVPRHRAPFMFLLFVPTSALQVVRVVRVPANVTLAMCRDDRMWSGEARVVDIFPVRLTGSAALAVPNVMATLQTRCLLSIFLVNLPKCVILKGKPIKTCALLLRELLNCCIPAVIQDSFCVLLNYVWK